MPRSKKASGGHYKQVLWALSDKKKTSLFYHASMRSDGKAIQFIKHPITVCFLLLRRHCWHFCKLIWERQRPLASALRYYANTRPPFPHARHKMSALLKSHDPFVLRSSSHAHINRQNQKMLSNVGSLCFYLPKTCINVPRTGRQLPETVVFLLGKLAAILREVAQEKKRGASDR